MKAFNVVIEDREYTQDGFQNALNMHFNAFSYQ